MTDNIQNKMLRVLIVEPNKEPYPLEIHDSLKAMQNIVGGNVQAVYPFDDNVIIFCNENGKDIGLESNRRIVNDIINDVIAGTFFIVGDKLDGDECSLTDEQIERYCQMFKKPE